MEGAGGAMTLISPMLSVRRGAEAVEFYQAAFGAEVLFRIDAPDAAFDRAVKAGSTVVVPLGNSHGWRLGRVVDPFGHNWEIGREL